MKTSKNAKLSPRINVSVQYDVPFEEVVQKITLLFETLVKVFSEIKSREKRTFEEKELYAILKERLPEFDISSIQLGLILDMITLNVDENATFTESRNSVRILQKRKQKNQDAYYDKFGHYIYLHDTKEVLTMHEWIRTLDLNDKFYFGGIVDYHW